MTLDCIIVDDEKTPRNILKQYIEKTSYLNFKKEFWNPIEAIQFIDQYPIDLIFLDIEMPRLSGLDFARILKKKHQIIFTTAHREFALEGFELNAKDYLLKPFSFQRFLEAVEKCMPIITAAKNIQEFIFVKVNKKNVRVNFNELLYIEGMSNYIKLHLIKTTLVAYEKLSVIIEQLPSYQFLRVHNSYIANLSKVESFTKEFLIINNKHIPISKTYRAAFLKQIEN